MSIKSLKSTRQRQKRHSVNYEVIRWEPRWQELWGEMRTWMTRTTRSDENPNDKNYEVRQEPEWQSHGLGSRRWCEAVACGPRQSAGTANVPCWWTPPSLPRTSESTTPKHQCPCTSPRTWADWVVCLDSHTPAMIHQHSHHAHIHRHTIITAITGTKVHFASKYSLIKCKLAVLIKINHSFNKQ